MSLISDEYNNFGIIGPSLIVGGDNITIVCGVSKYNYINDITWTYPNENQNKPSKFVNKYIRKSLVLLV